MLEESKPDNSTSAADKYGDCNFEGRVGGHHPESGIYKDSSELGLCLKYLFCGAPGTAGCCPGYCCTNLLCVPC